MFELTVLCGALSTVAGLFILSALRHPHGVLYDPSFSDDRIGIFVACRPDDFGPVEQVLQTAGVEEVKHATA